MTTKAERIIAGTCRRNPNADPDVLAHAIITDLTGNGLRITTDTSKTITYCPIHTSSKEPCRMPHATADTGDDQEGESQ